jgi:hypothetical protein
MYIEFMWIYVNSCELICIYVWVVRLSDSAAMCGSTSGNVAVRTAAVCGSALGSVC